MTALCGHYCYLLEIRPDCLIENIMSHQSLKNKTLFISGASRGIGHAIGMRAARDGANIVIAAKTVEPHPKLPGTIYSAAEDIEKAGGRALPLVIDVRDENSIRDAVEKAIEFFGGIDILVNNASAIRLTGTLDTPMRKFDLMHQVCVRGTFACSQACIPHLRNAENPHILNIAPPLNMEPRWFKNHVAYTMAKYGMSMCVLGMAEELKEDGIAVNALWPKTTIATAAMVLVGGPDSLAQCREPAIMADAAHAILTRPSYECTGNFFIDEEVMVEEGCEDLDRYSVVAGAELLPDFFL
jgi:citronellol/citronellal dehydrogenase